MKNFSALYPVDPVLTGLVCSTAPVQSLVGRQSVMRVPVNGKSYSGQIVVKSHISKMGGPGVTLRAPGAPMVRLSGKEPGFATYETRIYSAASDPVAPEEISRNQTDIDIVGDDMETVVNKLTLDEEARYAAKFFGTSIWTAEPTLSSLSISGGKWSTVATARPLGDLDIIRETYRTQSHGRTGDTCYIGATPFAYFCRSLEPRGLHLTTSGAGAIVSPLSFDAGRQYIADALRISVDRVFVGMARWNTSAIPSTHTEADIWGDFLWYGNLLGGRGVQVGSTIRMRGEAVALIGVDEESLFAEAMGGGFQAGAAGPYIAGMEQQPASEGGGISGWAQHYTDEAVLAADLGILVQDLV